MTKWVPWLLVALLCAVLALQNARLSTLESNVVQLKERMEKRKQAEKEAGSQRGKRSRGSKAGQGERSGRIHEEGGLTAEEGEEGAEKGQDGAPWAEPQKGKKVAKELKTNAQEARELAARLLARRWQRELAAFWGKSAQGQELYKAAKKHLSDLSDAAASGTS